MNLVAKTWLPPDAIGPQAVAPLLAPLVKTWSEHWLSSGEANLSPIFQDDWPRSDGSTCWRSLDDCASIALTPLTQASLASAMLGCPIPSHSLQPGDRTAIDKLAAASADDLIRRLAAAAGVKETAARIRSALVDLDDCSWWEVSFGPSKHALRLAIASAAAIGLVRSALPPPKAHKVENIRSGLAPQQVSLSLALGRSPISLAEVEGLSPGDVLILDQKVDCELDLLIDDRPSPLTAKIDSKTGAVSLLLGKRKTSSDA